MAHSCPDCGCLCHCGGDIDDIDFGDDTPEADECTHCQCDMCGQVGEYCECDPYDYTAEGDAGGKEER